jgi:hypothetical protein
MKTCKKCGGVEFYKSGGCKVCSKTYKTANSERLKAQDAAYRAANLERIKAYKAAYWAVKSLKTQLGFTPPDELVELKQLQLKLRKEIQDAKHSPTPDPTC